MNSLDAFSSLLSLDSSSSTSSKQTMSLAERQAQIAEEKRKKAEHERQQFEAHGAFWDNLGSSSSSSKATPVMSPVLPVGNKVEALLQPTISAPTSRPASSLAKPSLLPSPAAQATAKMPSSSSTWDDDDDFLAGPSTQKRQTATSSATKPPSDPFDFDAMDASLNSLAPTKRSNGSSGVRTPVSNFDFGDNEDDLLGGLGGPAKTSGQRTKVSIESRCVALAEAMQSPPRSHTSTNRKARSSSPPPHIIGQIVEMGFTPAQAREALAKTSNGLDVQAAMEDLLAQQDSRLQDSEDEERVMRERMRREEEEEKERKRKRRMGPSRDSVRARTRDEISQGAVTPDYGEQADKILAQASEIGQSVLSKASSFWATSKERALKVYEEQKRAAEAAQGKSKPVSDGRPRWMVEQEQADDEAFAQNSKSASNGGGFKDSDDEDGPVPARRPHVEPAPRRNGGPLTRAPVRKDDLLFADDAPSPSRSTAQRAQPTRQTQPRSRPITPAAPLPQRALVSTSATALQAAAAHKAKGNDHFKLGRFSEAEQAYTSAISALPEGHLTLVILYNNRAATRLKLGQSASAAEDCTNAITIVGPTYHPSKEAPLPPDVAAEVKLGDALVKATSKRAQAWEMAEKWKQAVEDWERVMAFDVGLLGQSAASTRNLAAEGARRSRKMLEGGDGPKPSIATPAQRPPAPIAARPVKPVDVTKSLAVSELRKAASAAEAEDTQRMAAKDGVDAKIVAWKAGNETNIRVLMSTLHKVLWEEAVAGGLKVGLHELVTPKQVKIKYMKVVARLHPDKVSFLVRVPQSWLIESQLDVSKTTVEQRMLANGVFSVLNEA
jgi:tetratricopeptide (TPR) repeat protein